MLLEVGPGRTLAQLARQSADAAAQKLVLSSLGDSGDAGEEATLVEMLGRLWLLGVDPDWIAFQGGPRRRVRLPTYPFERKRYWVEPPPLTRAHPGGAPAGLVEQLPRGQPDGAPADPVEQLVRAQLDIMQRQLDALAAED